MDRLPQIPKNEGANDTGGLLRHALQENIESEIYPLDIAENVSKYVIDTDLSLDDTGQNVLLINQHSVDESEKIKEIECAIIKDHGNYLCNKNVLEQNILLRELSKLKPCDIFTSLNPKDVENYGLIQKCNLYPDMVRQFLDFRFNADLHQCKSCIPTPLFEEKVAFKEKRKLHQAATRALEKVHASKSCLILDPKEVSFLDFHTGKIYEQTIKIMNVSSQIKKICLKTPPKLSVFKLIFQPEKMASGMSIYATIQFTPKVNLNLQDEVIFTYRNGPEVKVSIRCYRHPPKLLGYIRKSNDPQNIVIERSVPGSRSFLKGRRNAVNNTIDCGSCFVTDYVLLSLLLVNSSCSDAKFFLICEDDFFNEDINNVSTSMEFYNDCFWIYPTYFEIPARESLEINIIFQPTESGLYIKNFVLMCDNNTYKQIELVGDSVSFNRSLISVDIPYIVKDIDKKEDHCIFLGAIKTEEFIRLTLCTNNHSSMYLKYQFKFDTGDQNCNTEDDKFNMSKWITITNLTPVLPPYSVTDTVFHVKPNSNAEAGYYKSPLRLFITGIPIASLEEDQPFLVTINDRPLKKIVENLSVVDVLILDVTVTCYFEPQLQIKENPTLEEHVSDNNPVQCQGCCKIPCLCVDCKAPIPQAALVFSETILDMGILPTGVNIKKKFSIMNLGEKMLSWKIAEIKYNMSSSPYVDLISQNTSYTGTLNPGKKKHLRYIIDKKPPTRWVSVLVLFSITSDHRSVDNDNYSLVAESICVVTYEISELNVVITNGATTEPILCPLEMLYAGVPHQFSFKIQNYSLIGGCFYFLKPIGSDADKIQVEYKPQHGELNPRSKQTIKLTLTCNDVGILENIFLPCFVGRGQEPIMVRLLCVVDCIHVFFYLPNNISEYEKILWPPKVLYEYDRSWRHDYCMCEELFEEYENIIQNIQSENTMQIMEKSSKSDIKVSRSEMDGQGLLQTLVDADSEIFLQNCVMQVENVTTKHPTKITFYIENVTPKIAKYTIQSTNYGAKDNLIQDALNTTYKTTEELWEPLIDKHGILVHPESESGTINSYELLSANIWIYANTWGIYTEEIVVDIEEIACFAFTVIINVEGCPLQIPLGVGAITKYPTIRFGSVAAGDENVTKNIVLLNTSSIDFKISWHMFYSFGEGEPKKLPPFNVICDVLDKSDQLLDFDFTDRFYGIECGDCIQVQPSLLHLSGHSKIILPITFKPWNLNADQKKENMKCQILGRIFLTDENRTCNSFLMDATASVEKPCLDISVEAENNTLYVYANEITLNRDEKIYLQINVRNLTSAVIKARLGCSEPFGVEAADSELILNPGQCKKIKLLCKLSYDKIVKWGPYVYNLTELKDNRRPSLWDYALEENMTSDAIFSISHDKKYVDDERKVLTLPRKLFVNYKGGLKDIIPINVGIYYPNIAVKPIHVKFGYLLIGRTLKSSVAVYNLTGYRTLFEVLKSTSNQELVVTPCYGEIEKSVGVNHSFVEITIYFTPLECRNYQESIRICTNIPQYHIDIPIKGAGSYNEKFDGGS